jgi:hypothetical protein
LNVYSKHIMKKLILFIFLGFILTWQALHAQNTSSGSRLNMPTKEKTTHTKNLKYIGVPNPLNVKPLSISNKTTLSNFYRTFLFTNRGATDSALMSVTEVEDTVTERTKPNTEAVVHAEEQLYISDKITVSNIYPNPANEYAEMDVTISTGLKEAKIIIYNVLGSQMSELTINKNEKKIRLNTRDLPSGLYFYQLSVDGKKVATKKMIVRHQQ